MEWVDIDKQMPNDGDFIIAEMGDKTTFYDIVKFKDGIFRIAFSPEMFGSPVANKIRRWKYFL